MAARKKVSEFARIARIERLLAAHGPKPSSTLELGIGDDAALLRLRGRAVWTVDTQVEGVHFDRRWLSLEDIGYRSFQAAVSDLAAMGAEPLGALSSLALPSRLSERELERVVRGQADAAADCGCPIIGGNLSRAGELSVTTSVLGSVRRPLLRGAARAGDELWLIGDVGMAALGLFALSRGVSRRSAAVRACIERWRRPRALLREGLELSRRARAAIDVSDGLAGDAGHIARGSGVSLVFDAERLQAALTSELVRGAALLGLTALDLALGGGEDYALLCSGPAGRRPRFARVIGDVERGNGVWLSVSGRRKKLAGSFDHFRK
ncbi:MAG: thiamine-phosphate kinase [Polyangiaceae bacterium]